MLTSVNKKHKALLNPGTQKALYNCSPTRRISHLSFPTSYKLTVSKILKPVLQLQHHIKSRSTIVMLRTVTMSLFGKVEHSTCTKINLYKEAVVHLLVVVDRTLGLALCSAPQV